MSFFPNSVFQWMLNSGGNQNSGSDWLDYVYPNHGSVPTIE